MKRIKYFISIFLTLCIVLSMSIVASADTAKVKITLDNLPNYSDSAYVELNYNKPQFTKAEKKNKKAFEKYSELDELNRCGVAFANICKEIMPTEERGEIGMIKPSGWRYFLISAFTFFFATATDFCIAEAVQCSIAAIW